MDTIEISLKDVKGYYFSFDISKDNRAIKDFISSCKFNNTIECPREISGFLVDYIKNFDSFTSELFSKDEKEIEEIYFKIYNLFFTWHNKYDLKNKEIFEISRDVPCNIFSYFEKKDRKFFARLIEFNFIQELTKVAEEHLIFSLSNILKCILVEQHVASFCSFSRNNEILKIYNEKRYRIAKRIIGRSN